MRIKELANAKYIEFSKYEGSQHIAGQYALYRILELVEKYECASVLEIGLGIGTLPSLILENAQRPMTYVGTEANAFCLESLKKNLKPKMYQTLDIYDHLSSAMESEQHAYDFVIIDGKFDDFKVMSSKLSKHAIIVIEGDRMEQEHVVRRHFPKSKFVHLVSAEKNHVDGIFDVDSWQGGMKVFFINPTLDQWAYWMRGKVTTKMNYKKRRKANS